MVRSKGLEPSRLLGTTTSRLRVYQFHHERINVEGQHGGIVVLFTSCFWSLHRVWPFWFAS